MPNLQLGRGTHNPGVLADAPALAGVPGFARVLIPLRQAHELYERVRRSPEGFVPERLLAEMDVELEIPASDLERVPKKGPVVVVANHPYGMLDGAALATLLTRVRPDVKVLTNFLLEGVPELERHCIFVDPMQTQHAGARNRRALRQALAWLLGGGMLAIFPAGEVSHWQMAQAEVTDPRWSDVAARLVGKTGAAALPVYFCGGNSLGLQVVGLIHPRVRTLLLLEEFLQQAGKKLAVRVGNAIPADAVASLNSEQEAIEYLRGRTYLLGQRGRQQVRLPDVVRSVWQRRGPAAIAPALPKELLASDAGALPAERCLAQNGEFAVYAAQAAEVPYLLEEIGRLREVTFCQAGEGSGKRSDLDRFDRYYWHIFLWNRTREELVGAYRAANTAEVLEQEGLKGLYTSTLFRYDERFFATIGPALELGRSFVRREYQRQYAPLLLLWKGIGRFILRHPQTPVLFGAVSISNTYNRVSRELIYSFFELRRQGDALAGLVKPRRAFRPGRQRRREYRTVTRALRDLEELSEPIADVEIDGKGLPILLKQYARIGGRLLGFNLDHKFSDVLDGLVMVDLRQTPGSVLEKYMGREGAAAFRRHHGFSECGERPADFGRETSAF
jgi:putative hemolysin